MVATWTSNNIASRWAPPAADSVPLSFNHKTQLCTFYDKGRCTKGDSCTYAHGSEELRDSGALGRPPWAWAPQQLSTLTGGRMPSITSSLNYGISQQQQNRLAAAQQHLQHRQTDEVGAAVVSLARVAALLQQREPELYAQLLESDAAGRAGGAINSSARGGAGGDHGGSRRSGAAQEDEAFRQGKTPCLCPRSSPPPGFERRVPAVDSSAGTACTRVHPRGEDSGQGLFGASGSVSWRRAALQPADERALTAASGGGAASLDSSYSPPHGRSLAASKTPTESASGATFFRGAAVAGGPPPGADRFRVVQQKRVERIAAGPGTTTGFSALRSQQAFFYPVELSGLPLPLVLQVQ